MNKSDKNRELVFKALVDVNFRTSLERDPARALGVKVLTDQKKLEVRKILDTIKRIDAQIGAMADELLCANGGPPGIA